MREKGDTEVRVEFMTNRAWLGLDFIILKETDDHVEYIPEVRQPFCMIPENTYVRTGTIPLRLLQDIVNKAAEINIFPEVHKRVFDIVSVKEDIIKEKEATIQQLREEVLFLRKLIENSLYK